MNFFRSSLIALLFFTCLGLSAPARSSYDPQKKTEEACMKLLEGVPYLRAHQPPSAQLLVPLSQVIGNGKCNYIAALRRWRIPYAASMASEGLGMMYQTAGTAAREVMDQLNVEAVRPVSESRNPFSAAAATIDLIESKNPPEYIRNAVLIRDNIVMTVPLLKRIRKWHPKTKKPVYAPIIIKGHQELEDSDLLAAGFAAWALEPWQGQVPKEADIYLRPMVEKRTRDRRTDARFTIEVESYLPQVRQMAEDFHRISEQAQHADDRTIAESRPERRCTQCSVCPWAGFCKEKLKQAKDFSMIPLPPTRTESAALVKLGYQNLEDLARINIHSDDFAVIALRANITPERLYHFVSHALATVTDSVLLIKRFDDPTVGKTDLVHYDVEDLMIRGVLSGVYLQGLLIEDLKAKKGGKKPGPERVFLMAKKLDQDSIDDVWNQLVQTLKTHKRLKSGNYWITIYSKHEIVKFEQEFDILKQRPDKFTDEERASEFYSAVTLRGKEVGRLIRRKEFFEKHTDVTPRDIFEIMDRTLDLLDYSRGNFAFPGHTNGLKSTSVYAGAEPYHAGDNGLESMAWSRKAYETNEPALLRRPLVYNGKDVDNNQIVLNLFREHAGEDPDLRLNRDEAYYENTGKIVKALLDIRWVSNLQRKSALLQAILGKSLSALSESQKLELAAIFDRKSYLKKRTQLRERNGLSENVLQAILQFERFQFETNRQKRLYEFFKAVNPSLAETDFTPATEALTELFEQPAQFMTANHVTQIALLEEVEPDALSLPVETAVIGNVTESRLPLPASWNSYLQSSPGPKALRKRILQGLYLKRAFPPIRTVTSTKEKS